MAERLYRIHAVAGMVGLSESLLRAWERRYQVLVPRRSASGYRGYTDADVELLRRVKRLTEEGMSIGDVAPLLPGLRRAAKVAARVAPLLPPASAGPAASSSKLASWRDAMLAAAEASAQEQVEVALDEALATLPALTVIDELIIPVLREVGQRWHAGRLNVAQEHLVSHAIRARLLSLIHGAPRGARRHAVCACFPEEDHELGLLSVAFRLRLAGYRVTYLGPRTPFEHLAELTARLSPDLVALSLVAHVPRGVFEQQLQLAAKAAGRATLLIGGAGAEAHADAIASAGASVVGPGDWARVLA